MSMYLTEPDSSDPGRLRSAEDYDRPESQTCDTCGDTAIFPITLAGLGTFCSARCVDVTANKHAAIMENRRRAG